MRTSFEQANIKASTGADTVGVEVNCFASTYEASIELAEAVRTALDHKKGWLEGLIVRSCSLADASEGFQDGAFVQNLVFAIKI
jgi:hypothetical protein